MFGSRLISRCLSAWEYFMESAGVRYLRTSCWHIRNRTSERSERLKFLIQKQRVRKYRTKHFSCGIVFIIYILRHSSFWRPFYFKSFKNAKICRYNKRHNKSLRLVLFTPFRCCFPGSLPFTLSTVKQTKLLHSISEMFFTFLARKTHGVKLFTLNVCEAALQAAIKGGNFGAKLAHPCGFWLDVSFFSRVKKHRSRFWLDVSFFSHVKTIVRSSDWLELICVRKFTT